MILSSPPCAYNPLVDRFHWHWQCVLVHYNITLWIIIESWTSTGKHNLDFIFYNFQNLYFYTHCTWHAPLLSEDQFINSHSRWQYFVKFILTLWFLYCLTAYFDYITLVSISHWCNTVSCNQKAPKYMPKRKCMPRNTLMWWVYETSMWK